MNEIYTDIINLLNNKSEEPIIILSKKLIKNTYVISLLEDTLEKKEIKRNENKLINEIKKEIIKLQQEKNLHLKTILIGETIREEELDFVLKLIYKDKILINQLETLKNRKNKENNLEDLKQLLQNTKKSSEQILKQLEKISNIKSIQKAKNPILNVIKEKEKKETINKELDYLKTLIETSKTTNENKNMKEEYFTKTDIQETLEQLEDICEIKDISQINNIKIKLKKSYEKVIELLEKSINKKELENEILPKKEYNKNIQQYIYDKQNNITTYVIEHISKEENTLFLNIILILKLIKEIENNNEFYDIIKKYQIEKIKKK